MPNGIERYEDWANLTKDQQDYKLWETLNQLLSADRKHAAACLERVNTCEKRFQKIEKRKWWNAGASAGGGIVGGFIAMLLKFKFWS